MGTVLLSFRWQRGKVLGGRAYSGAGLRVKQQHFWAQAEAAAAEGKSSVTPGAGPGPPPVGTAPLPGPGAGGKPSAVGAQAASACCQESFA
jgi:hypothetical protein